MLHEVVDWIAAHQPELIVDCTVGGAGHATALLNALPDSQLLGLDRDSEAVRVARERLSRFGERAQVYHARFSQLETVLGVNVGRVGALVADLGVSSHQIDTASRGFSFRFSGDLDMRMDRTSGQSAREVVASVDAATLATAIKELGEERHARRVARAIKAERPTTTEELAAIVRRNVPAARDGLDPATRTFQAIRMLVNDEVGELERLLLAIPKVLADGGIAVFISFHSLEDRSVKRALRDAAQGCICPPVIGGCVCNNRPSLEILTRRVVRPGSDEIARNPRAASARLRAARRLERTR